MPAMDPQASESRSLGFVRTTALYAAVIGAAGSLWLMLRAGHNNRSIILLVIVFAGWVLSPFVALTWAHRSSRGWPVLNRSLLHAVMFVVALGSLAVYGINAIRPLSAKGAFIFLVVPAASWLLVAIVLSAAAMGSGKRSSGTPEG